MSKSRKWFRLGGAVFFSVFWASASAQQEWLDDLLPPGHLLVPLDVEGLSERPLFYFKDFDGNRLSDLILAYCSAKALEQGDEPSIRVAICLQSSGNEGYRKIFESTGGTVKKVWVREQRSANPWIGIEREDQIEILQVNGETARVVLHVRGKEAQGNLVEKDGTWLWRSGEKVWTYDKNQKLFLGALEKQESKPSQEETPFSFEARRKSAEKPGELLEIQDVSQAFEWLLQKEVPFRVRRKELAVLGKTAGEIFERMREEKVPPRDFVIYRSRYYVEVARRLGEIGQREQGEYYLSLVLKGNPDFQPALDLKARWEAERSGGK